MELKYDDIDDDNCDNIYGKVIDNGKGIDRNNCIDSICIESCDGTESCNGSVDFLYSVGLCGINV